MKIVRKIIHDLIMILVPKALRKNMLTCEQVALIIAEKPNLSAFKKTKLQMHLFVCQSCLNYKNQIKIIDSESKNLGKINLTDSQKQKIIKSRSEISKKYSK
jgi:hypothetical protein